VRVVILSDVHGNSTALDAVLRDIDATGGADRIIVNGDLCAFGPRPEESLARLRSLPNATFVQGNTDRYLVARPSPVPATDSTPARLRAGCGWAAARIGEDGLRFLAALPNRQEVDDAHAGRLLVVHASPRSDEEGIGPDTTPAQLSEIMTGIDAAFLCCGHTHVPWRGQWGGTTIINEGAVGFPMDGDSRASYATAVLEPQAWHVELHRVVYDVDSVINDLYARQLPAADIFAKRLRRAGKEPG